MNANGGSAPVRVMIFGEEYQIRTDLGEEYTRKCAQFVDEAIQEAHVAGHIAEPHRAAILAALKITDELFRTRREVETMSETVQTRISELAGHLEAAADPGGAVMPATELALDV